MSRLLLLVGLAAAALVGCGPRTYVYHDGHYHRVRGRVVVVNKPPPTTTVVVREERAELPPLDPTAARNAFAAVDFSPCQAPPTVGHAKVTLNPDGHVSRVEITDPGDLDPEIAQCIGRQIGRASVQPFRGGMVVLGTTFRVR
jgi:hypothetical protein